MTKQPKKCECGADMRHAAGEDWCTRDIERYVALYGEPKRLWNKRKEPELSGSVRAPGGAT